MASKAPPCLGYLKPPVLADAELHAQKEYPGADFLLHVYMFASASQLKPNGAPLKSGVAVEKPAGPFAAANPTVAARSTDSDAMIYKRTCYVHSGARFSQCSWRQPCIVSPELLDT